MSELIDNLMRDTIDSLATGVFCPTGIHNVHLGLVSPRLQRRSWAGCA